MLTVGSLFSGIGGIDLGLERAGMQVVWQVEIDEWCRRVLTKHWPDVPKYGDIRGVRGSDIEPVDVLAGGFPCQPVSVAGQRKGKDDLRWLWPEFVRLIRETQPRFVLAENVPGLRSADNGRLFGGVLADLASCGYDAEWDCIPASAVGAPHIRDRVWIVAYPNGVRGGTRPRLSDERGQGLPDTDRSSWSSTGSSWEDVADAERFGRARSRVLVHPSDSTSSGEREATQSLNGGFSREWAVEPDVGRVAYGIPRRVDRLRGLGNAVVPQVVEHIGRRIVEVA